VVKKGGMKTEYGGGFNRVRGTVIWLSYKYLLKFKISFIFSIFFINDNWNMLFH
jgi:hypothetical protein